MIGGINLNSLRNRLKTRILVVAASLAFTLWVFIEVAEEVWEGEAGVFDRSILLSLHTSSGPDNVLGPIWLQAVARDVSALGSITVLGIIVAVVTLFLLLTGRRMIAMFLLLASTSGGLATFLLKAVFNRPRPELFQHGDYVISASFPSGHAMIAALVYLTLGALMAQVMPIRKLKVYVMTVMLALTVIIGASRVYLGVHWPTDVLAGWFAGASWALGWWIIAEFYKVKSGSRV